MRKFFELESEGKLPKGTTKKWIAETPGGTKKLPMKVNKRTPKK